MKLTAIAAVAKNGVIGSGSEGGGIPWHQPRDAEHFRNYTKGKWMLLGRVTYQEMDGWFQDQIPIVMTRTPDQLEVPNGFAVESIDAAIEIAESGGAGELVVSGGSEIYQIALGRVDTLLLTRIQAEIEGGAFFPEWSEDDWTLVKAEDWPADSKNLHAMRFETWLRNKGCKSHFSGRTRMN